MADNNDAMITNATPLLCQRIIRMIPMQLNRAAEEHILVAYIPYASEVVNNIAIPTIIITIFVVRANFKYALRILLLVLSVISNVNS